jgi:catechol 2,3-dioxygenase-like lactoylglutathione lyase family enzyme
MNILVLIALMLAAASSLAQSSSARTPARPKITGIDHVSFYTTNPDGNTRLYAEVLGLAAGDPVERGQTQRFVIGSQWVGYSPAPDANAADRMDHIAFATDDCEGLRVYLKASGIKVEDSTHALKARCSLVVKDPEGHSVEFVQGPIAGNSPEMGKSDPVSRRMIHTGFIVRDQAKEDHFYKDILGFRLYWYGGMQSGRTDWMALQVPDGTDWLEYMLHADASPSLRQTGVMHHISLGVRDMKQAQAKLEAHGWKPHGDEHSQMGKDGKWQLNVFDPDLTRIELMEFTPAEKPCCSDFQGPHPSEP